MKEYIESMIENLKESLAWKEKELEKSRTALVESVSKRTAEEIAHGWLESDIGTIGREYEEVKSLRDQIKILEHALKSAD